MTATRSNDSTQAQTPCLYLAFELGWSEWKLAFTIGAGQKPRLRSVPARDRDRVLAEIAKATRGNTSNDGNVASRLVRAIGETPGLRKRAAR